MKTLVLALAVLTVTMAIARLDKRDEKEVQVIFLGNGTWVERKIIDVGSPMQMYRVCRPYGPKVYCMPWGRATGEPWSSGE